MCQQWPSTSPSQVPLGRSEYLHTYLSHMSSGFISIAPSPFDSWTIGPGRPSLLEGLALTLPTQAIEGRFGRLSDTAVGFIWPAVGRGGGEVVRLGALAVVRGGIPSKANDG